MTQWISRWLSKNWDCFWRDVYPLQCRPFIQPWKMAEFSYSIYCLIHTMKAVNMVLKFLTRDCEKVINVLRFKKNQIWSTLDYELLMKRHSKLWYVSLSTLCWPSVRNKHQVNIYSFISEATFLLPHRNGVPDHTFKTQQLQPTTLFFGWRIPHNIPGAPDSVAGWSRWKQ